MHVVSDEIEDSSDTGPEQGEALPSRGSKSTDGRILPTGLFARGRRIENIYFSLKFPFSVLYQKPLFA